MASGFQILESNLSAISESSRLRSGILSEGAPGGIGGNWEGHLEQRPHSQKKLGGEMVASSRSGRTKAGLAESCSVHSLSRWGAT